MNTKKILKLHNITQQLVIMLSHTYRDKQMANANKSRLKSSFKTLKSWTLQDQIPMVNTRIISRKIKNLLSSFVFYIFIKRCRISCFQFTWYQHI